MSSSRRTSTLQAQLMARDHEAEGAAPRSVVDVQRLRWRADALRRKVEEVAAEDEAATAAARGAERTALKAARGARAALRTREMYGERRRVLAEEMDAKDARIRLLEAILDTLSA